MAEMCVREDMQTRPDPSKPHTKGKRQRINLRALSRAMGWIYHMIRANKCAGMRPDRSYPEFSKIASIRISAGYLVDMTWLSAILWPIAGGQSPAGGTTGLPPNKRVMKQLAGLIKNYRTAGLYEEGTAPVGKRSSRLRPQGDVKT